MIQHRFVSRLCVAMLALCALALPAQADEKPGAEGTTEEAQVPWVRDLTKAKEQAAKEGKDLLINFTGSDWCIYCMRLEGEVFSRTAFVDEAVKQFVFVFMDNPRDPELIKAVVDVKARDKLQGDLGVGTFPTVVLATADGSPYARTGYRPGGAEAYRKHIAELRAEGTKVRAMLNPDANAETVKEGLEVLAKNVLLGYPGYEDLLKDAEKADPDGKLGIRKIVVEERIRQLKAKEDAALRAVLPKPGESPDWARIAAALKETKHLTGIGFLEVLFQTVNWLIEEKQDGAEAKALLELAKRDPTLEDHAAAQEIWAEMAAGAEKLLKEAEKAGK